MTAKRVTILVQGEGGTEARTLTRPQAERLRKIMLEVSRTGEWNDMANDILDKSKPARIFGVVDTSGDGAGWYTMKELMG